MNKCPKCGREPIILFIGERSREHEEDYPSPSSVLFCTQCNLMAIQSVGYVSWWTPAMFPAEKAEVPSAT